MMTFREVAMIDVYTLEESYRGYDIVVKLRWSIGEFTAPNHWYCGYVRIPEGHKLYGAGCIEIDRFVSVHGGVTYAGEIIEADGFYAGIDCAHLGDTPQVQDEAYTLDECKRLVDQLIEVDDAI